MSSLTAIMTREFATSETKMMEYENAMKTHLTKLHSLVVMNDAMVPLTVEFMVFFFLIFLFFASREVRSACINKTLITFGLFRALT